MNEKDPRSAEAIAEAREKKLTLWGHLDELRRRLFRVAIALVLGSGLGFYLAPSILQFLLRPMGGEKPQAIELTEYLAVYFNLSLLTGLAVALPVVLYETIMFLLPGLTPRERRYVYILLPSASLLFVIGLLFSNFVLLPPALGFLLHWGSDIVTIQPRIGNYINVITRLMFWTGIIFETPLLMVFLAKIGVMSYRTFARGRRWILILAFVVGAIVTPTMDPINQTMVAVPVIILYELGIWISWLVARPKKTEAS
ncbi:MAG: twin-arginine translocase subunit TatC [Chloroflexi bacterium]|nr:twin-arginine translocase subunit TatC [Chloroflexota bacterium]